MDDINALTRAGENICSCGVPKQMYYKPWCPICDKPQIEQQPTLNLIKALDHLEAIGHEGIKDRLHAEFIYDIKNDTAFLANFEYEEGVNEISDDRIVMGEVFSIHGVISLYVSW